jgi:hypothetical protein
MDPKEDAVRRISGMVRRRARRRNRGRSGAVAAGKLRRTPQSVGAAGVRDERVHRPRTPQERIGPETDGGHHRLVPRERLHHDGATRQRRRPGALRIAGLRPFQRDETQAIKLTACAAGGRLSSPPARTIEFIKQINLRPHWRFVSAGISIEFHFQAD